MFIPTREIILAMKPSDFEKYSLKILKEQTEELKNVKIVHDKIIEANDGNYQIDGYI